MNALKFAELYMQFRPLLIKIAYDDIPNVNVCEDLLHDCFLNCMKHFEKVEKMNVAAVKAYLKITVKNLSINYKKKNSRVRLIEDEEIDISDVEDEKQNFEIDYDKKIVFSQMINGFEKLSERDKCLLMMKYNLRLRDNEIASIFNIKEDSVRMATKRAVDKLKKRL